jgi:hypothetical protein
MRKVKKNPKFKNEAEERAFWEKHDSSDYVDWTKAQAVTLGNLKPSSKAAPKPPLATGIKKV